MPVCKKQIWYCYRNKMREKQLFYANNSQKVISYFYRVTEQPLQFFVVSVTKPCNSY